MQFSCPIPGFHCWKKTFSPSHRWNLTEGQNDDAADYGGDLEAVDYPVVGDVVDGVEDDQVAGIDDGHQAERDERGQPDCFDGQVHHNQQCQVKLAKIHPKVKVRSVYKTHQTTKPEYYGQYKTPSLEFKQPKSDAELLK